MTLLAKLVDATRKLTHEKSMMFKNVVRRDLVPMYCKLYPMLEK